MLAAELTILTHERARARPTRTNTHAHAHKQLLSIPPELSRKKFEEEQHGGVRVRACAAALA